MNVSVTLRENDVKFECILELIRSGSLSENVHVSFNGTPPREAGGVLVRDFGGYRCYTVSFDITERLMLDLLLSRHEALKRNG